MKKIIDWYKARPKWLRVVLAILLCIPIILVLVYLAASGYFKPPKDGDVLDTAIDGHEKAVDRRLAQLKAKDKEAEEKVGKAVEEIERLDKEGAKAKTEREKNHAAIDRATSWDDLDDIGGGGK